MKRLDGFDAMVDALAYIQENVYGCASKKEAEKYLRAKLPKESYYQKKIMDFLKKEYPKAFVWKAAAGAYSQQGIPDVCAVIDGRYYGFEVKRPYIGVPSEIQKRTVEMIREAGGCAGFVTFPADVQKMIEGGLSDGGKQI